MSHHIPCPLTMCNFLLTSPPAFLVHLHEAHDLSDEQPILSLFEYYSAFYCANPYNNKYDIFAPFCSICRKTKTIGKSKRPIESAVEEISLEEKRTHLSNHYFLPELFCEECEVWFEESKRDDHMTDQHLNTDSSPIRRGDTLFKGKQLSAYHRFMDLLSQSFNLDTAKLSDMPDVGVTNKPGFGNNIRHYQHIIRNEYSIEDISVFNGNFLHVFLAIGNMNFVGELVQISSHGMIEDCCAELEVHFPDLLQHRVASPAFTNLLIRAPTKYWNSFLCVIAHFKNRVANCTNASTLIRRLLTFAPISLERKRQLSNALLSDNNVNIDILFSGRYKSYILQGIAFQHSEASLILAEYLRGKIYEFSVHPYYSHSIRYMIRTAIKHHPPRREYLVFLSAIENTVDSIKFDQYGSYVVTCLMFNAPEFATNLIRTIMASRSWLFLRTNERRIENFRIRELCDIICTAANMSLGSASSVLLYGLSIEQTKVLITDRYGNPILCHLVKLADDKQAIKHVYEHVKNVYYQFPNAHLCRKAMIDRLTFV